MSHNLTQLPSLSLSLPNSCYFPSKIIIINNNNLIVLSIELPLLPFKSLKCENCKLNSALDSNDAAAANTDTNDDANADELDADKAAVPADVGEEARTGEEPSRNDACSHSVGLPNANGSQDKPADRGGTGSLRLDSNLAAEAEAETETFLLKEILESSASAGSPLAEPAVSGKTTYETGGTAAHCLDCLKVRSESQVEAMCSLVRRLLKEGKL